MFNQETSETRRVFYKTDQGMAVKKRYKEKANVKRMILYQLTQINVSTKAELSLETISNFGKMLN